MRDKHWASAEEAVQQVMAAEKCSRRTARRILATAIKEGRIRTTEGFVESPTIPQEQVRQRLQNDPDGMFLTLEQLVREHDCTVDELLGELQSGRLVAFPLDESAMLRSEVNGKANAADFGVTATALIAWLQNPETPELMIAKFKKRVQ